MIVIEGPDGAGKTTLCNWICDQFELKMGERGIKDRDRLFEVTREDTWRAMTYELELKGPPLVWDRLGPYSDPVYAPLGVPERKVAFTSREIRMFDFFAQSMGVVILCLPDFNTVKRNVEKEHQMAGVKDNIGDICQAYRRTMCHVFPYDYERGGLESIAIIVNVYLQRRKERECLSSLIPAVSG